MVCHLCIARELNNMAVLTRDINYGILILQHSLVNKILLIRLQVASQRLRKISDRLLPFIGGATA